MSVLATTTATAIAAASAATAFGSFLAYLRFATRSEAHAARDEALALAATRREVIADLRQRIDALEHLLDATTLALLDVRTDLEQMPPEIDRPLARIRTLLSADSQRFHRTAG